MGTPNHKLFDFFRLIGQLKATRRTGWVERNVNDPESIADHMYRMAILSFLVDPKDGLDKDRCIKLSLVHDMAECIVGDIAPSDGISKEEKYKREKAAMEHIKQLLPTEIGQEIYDIWEEYETQKSKESRFVKDLDRFDMVMQAYEYEKDDGKPKFLQDFFDSTKGKFESPQVKQWVEDLNQIRDGHSTVSNSLQNNENTDKTKDTVTAPEDTAQPKDTVEDLSQNSNKKIKLVNS